MAALTEQNKQALLLGGILGGAVLVIIIWIAWSEAIPRTTKLRNDTEKLQTETVSNRNKLETYTKYLNDDVKRAQLREAFDIVQSRLPTNQDPIEIYDLLRGYFEGTEVQFSFLEPKPEANRGPFREYPFTIKGTARYHEFGQLINLIECNPDRLMRVTDFKLINNPKRPSIHPMEVSISTFTFNEPG
ncbi:type 4a pilus biogenesis protein PilO [Candidatus Sumerlaeota bacterium]|nr:type 4a pilus biogenesis protein PilO [Candidatus Sumerlaeota bacterium]